MEPSQVISEACRTLKPGGKLVIVDFAPHNEEHLRSEHQHQRLGFADTEIRSIMKNCGMKVGKTHKLEGDPLTVCIWQATRSLSAVVTESDARAGQPLH